MEYKFSKYFCIQLKSCLAFLFCITFSLQCNAKCYSFDKIECKAEQYYEQNECKNCSDFNEYNKKHYMCTNKTDWCANRYGGLQGLSKCLDVYRDNETEYSRREFVNGLCTVISMYVNPDEVIVWDNDDEVWFVKSFDSYEDVPEGSYGSTSYSLASYGWVDIRLLDKIKKQTNFSWLIKDGKKYYLPYGKIFNSNGGAPVDCPDKFFAFGAQYCIKKGKQNVDVKNGFFDTITKDNVDNVKKLTYDQVEQYNKLVKSEEDEESPDTVEVSNTSNDINIIHNANIGNLVSSFNAPNLSNIRLGAIDVKCDPGNLWVNGGCVSCKAVTVAHGYLYSNRFYCPGFDKLKEKGRNYDLNKPLTQIMKCPQFMWPNENFDNCECKWGSSDSNGGCKNIKLDANDLKYGTLGPDVSQNKQCWTKQTKTAYRKCMGAE